MLEHIRQLFTVRYTLRRGLLALIVFILLNTKVFAQVETTIITLKVNDSYFYDYEVIVNSDDTFSVPFKSTAKLLNINHTKYKLIPDNKKIIFVREGILEQTKNEVFVPIKMANELLGVELISDMNDYSISLISDNVAAFQAKVSAIEQVPEYNKEINLVLPDERPFFTVDALHFDEAFQSDFTTEKDLIAKTNDELLNNSAQSVLTGRIFNGDYKIRTNLRSYEDELFSFSGINANYERDWDNYRLELGNVSGLKISDIDAGYGVLGINFNNSPKKRRKKLNFDSFVNQKGDVNVYVNDKFLKTTTFEEFKKEHSQEIIKEDSKDKFAVIAGITGYQNSFFSNYELENDDTAKKLVAGTQYSRKITPKFEVNTLAIGDYIFSKPNICDIGLYSSIPLLALNINKNFRCTDGISAITSLKHQTTEHFSITSDLGGSASSMNMGYMGTMNLNYERDNWDAFVGAFDYSPKFYLAGSSGLSGNSASVNDKIGFKTGGNFKHKLITLNGEVSRYNSNRDNYMLGGDFEFLDYNVRARVPITRRGYINLYRHSRQGDNNAGEIDSFLNRMDFNYRLTSRLNFRTNWMVNKFMSQYSDVTLSNTDYSSKYSNLAFRTDYRIPKNIGSVSLIHETTDTKAGSYKRDNNTMRLGYTFPRFFNIGTSVTMGYKYSGSDKGADLSLLVDYMFPSGRTLGVNYQFNRQQGMFFEDIYIPRTSRHSFTVNLSDIYSFVEGEVRPDGFYSKYNGHIKVVSFLDINKDGILNKGEPKIPDIPLRLSDSEKTYNTNKKGVYLSKSMPEGFYDVKLNYYDLPTLLSISPASNSEYSVKVERKNCTKVYIGLISSVGNVSGKILITDEFGRHIKLDNLVVTIHDEKGEEINYTIVSEGETYYLTGLSPGKYTISLDDSLVKEHNLVGSEKTVTIPPVFEDYVDIEGFDLQYHQTFETL